MENYNDSLLQEIEKLKTSAIQSVKFLRFFKLLEQLEKNIWK